MKRLVLTAVAAAVTVLPLSGCSKARGATAEEKREYTRQMAADHLAELHQRKPETRDMVARAEGYGVFSNIGSQTFFLASGNGYGVVVDNATKEETFMRMSQLGVGIGIGVNDYYAVMIYHDRKSMDDFIAGRFQFSGEADAAAKAGGAGGAAAGDTVRNTGISVYEWTDAGIQLRASVVGTKFKVDRNLTVGG